MDTSLPVKPRFISGIISLVLVTILMINETLSSEAGITLFVGILSGLGIYHMKVGNGGSK